MDRSAADGQVDASQHVNGAEGFVNVAGLNAGLQRSVNIGSR